MSTSRIFLSLFFAGWQCAAAVPDDIAVSANARVDEVTEIRVPRSAAITATFRSPHGKSLSLASFENSGSRIVRFTPTEPGAWRYRILEHGRQASEGTIQVAPGVSRGFIRAHGHALMFGDGKPFLALGENRINIYDRSWNWQSLGIEEYVNYMADHGMTVLRVFIVTDIENEERGGSNAGVLEPAVGRFDEAVAAQFDTIFRVARARGIYIVLVAFALGFSEEDAWKSWHDNPYARERGGPAADRFDFFESPQARAQAAGRIRYLAARYAAWPNLLALDLLNEPEWDGAIPETLWTPWAQEMTRAWRSADPYGHLVTLGSVGLHWNTGGDERAWWSSDACDVVQWHLYGPEIYEVHALAAEMTRKVRETWDRGKPLLVGEFAYGGEAKPGYDHTHVGLWSAVFSGAGVLAHSAPPFNIDSDEWMTPERAKHFRVLHDFFQPLPALTPIGASASSGALAWALSSEQMRIVAVWVLAPPAGYGKSVDDARLTLACESGRWRVQWSDDTTGTSLGDAIAQCRGGQMELNAPRFNRHVVALLRKQQ